MSHGEDKIYSCSKFMLSRRASKPTALMQTFQFFIVKIGEDME